MTAPTADDARALLATLPVYTSVAAAASDGVEEGDPFVLHTILIGLGTVRIIVIKS